MEFRCRVDTPVGADAAGLADLSLLPGSVASRFDADAAPPRPILASERARAL